MNKPVKTLTQTTKKRMDILEVIFLIIIGIQIGLFIKGDYVEAFKKEWNSDVKKSGK